MFIRCIAETSSLDIFGRAATAAQQSSSSRGKRRYSLFNGTRFNCKHNKNVSSSRFLFSVNSIISRNNFAFSSLYSDVAKCAS